MCWNVNGFLSLVWIHNGWMNVLLGCSLFWSIHRTSNIIVYLVTLRWACGGGWKILNWSIFDEICLKTSLNNWRFIDGLGRITIKRQTLNVFVWQWEKKKKRREEKLRKLLWCSRRSDRFSSFSFTALFLDSYLRLVHLIWTAMSRCCYSLSHVFR